MIYKDSGKKSLFYVLSKKYVYVQNICTIDPVN